MTFFFLISYYNIHFTNFLQELAKIEGVTVSVGLLNDFSKYRSGYDWANDMESNIYFQVDKQPNSLSIKRLRNFDYVGLLGVLGELHLYSTALKVLYFAKGTNLLIFSEGWKPKGYFTYWKRKIALTLLNHSKVTLFAIGTGCYLDYRCLGMSKWSAYKFGFSVKPPSKPPQKVSTNEVIRFVYIGQLVQRKRVVDLIKAFAYCKDSVKKITLDIFGSGEQKSEIKELIHELDIDKSVTLHGLIPLQDLYQRIADYDCLVLPSEYDGWGAVVNEAMQYGLAVIVSEGVRAREIVKENINGFHFPIGDENALAGKMLSIINDVELRTKFQLASLSLIRDYYPAELASRCNQILRARLEGYNEPSYSTALQKLSQ